MRTFKLLLLAFILTSVSSSLNAQITESLTFDQSDLSLITNGIYTQPSFVGCLFINNIGAPNMPVFFKHYVLPKNAEITGIIFSDSSHSTLPGSYIIYPAQPPIILDGRPLPPFVEPDSVYYSSTSRYSGEIVEIQSLTNFMGYLKLTLKISPLQYISTTQQLILFNSLSFTINYQISGTDPLIKEITMHQYDEIVRSLYNSVENTDDIVNLGPMSYEVTNYEGTRPLNLFFLPGAGGENVEYLIITNDDLAGSFEELVNWKSSKGIPSLVVTTSQIDFYYPGFDLAEKIFNYLKDVFKYWNGIYVVLGGDTEIIPSRIIFWNGNTVSDLYYSDVKKENVENYCWDENHNGDFGDDDQLLDLGPDHFVGRAPVHSRAEVQKFIEKIKNYEQGAFSQNQIENITFIGAYTDICDEIHSIKSGMKDWWNDASDFIPETFSITKLYDDPAYWDGTDELNHDNVMDALINDPSPLDIPQHIIAHIDHSGVNSIGASIICHSQCVKSGDLDDIAYKPETIYKILYSGGCEPNEFNKDCFGEHFMNGSGSDELHSGIGIGFIGNTDLGSSNEFTMGIKFIEHLYDKPLVNLGRVFNESRTYGKAAYAEKVLNFLGDPELVVWTDNLDGLSILKNPEVLIIGENQLEITVNGLSGNEKALVCIYKENEIYGIQMTENINGSQKAIFSHCKPDTYGLVSITATAPNHLYAITTIPVETNPQPDVHLYITGFDPDPLEMDRGTNHFYIFLKNAGNNLTATHVKASLTLTSACEGVVIYPSPPHNYPDIDPNQTYASLNEFYITILESAKDQFFVPLTLNIESDQGNFTEDFFLQIKSSQIQYRGNKISWTSENDDIFIEQGEEVKFKVELFNTGCKNASISAAAIELPEPTTIDNIIVGNVSFGTIEPHNTSWCTGEFKIKMNNTFPVGTETHSLILKVTETISENESIIHSFNIRINNTFRPTQYAFEPGGNFIKLKWGDTNSSDEFEGFNIYRLNADQLPPEGDIEDSTLYTRLNLFINHLPTYTDLNVETGKIYYYKISGYIEGLPQGPFTPAYIAWTTLPSLEPWPVFLPDFGHRSEGSPILYNAIPQLDNVDNPEMEIFFPMDDGADFRASISALYGFYSNGQELYDIDNDPEKHAGFANFLNVGMKATPIVGEMNNNNSFAEVALATTLGGGADVKRLIMYSAGDQIPAPEGDGFPDLLHSNLLGQPVKTALVASPLLPDGEVKIVTTELWHGIVDVRNTSNGQCYGYDWPVTLPHLMQGEEEEGLNLGIPVIADLDLDDDNEIIVGCRGDMGSHGIYIFNHDGSYFGNPGEPFYVPQNTSNLYGMDCIPVVTELDHTDQNPEIILLSAYCVECEDEYPTLTARINALNHDGSVVPGWEENKHEIEISANSFGIYPALCVADLDGDELVEIIVADESKVYIWKYTGVLLNENFPLQVEGLKCCSISPLIANIDQDPENEIIVASSSYADLIYAFNQDGSQVSGWPLAVDGLMATPAIGDINHDGLNEIVAVYGGYVNVWKTEGETGHDQWPLYRLNSFNNAVYTEPACEYDPNDPLIYEEANNEINWDGYNVLTSDLIIPASETLTIHGRVAMPDGSKIIVQRGGRLEITGGVITSACGGFWKGIEVWGYSDKSQIDHNFPSGAVYVTENGLIENARTAISTIKTDNGINNDDYTGGIVVCSDATFLNNVYAIRFYSYRNFNPFNILQELPNVSGINKCNFETNGRLADPTAYPLAFIKMDNVYLTNLNGNSFVNSTGKTYPWSNRGIGIESHNAAYSVDEICLDHFTPCNEYRKSYFYNLFYGVRSFGEGLENRAISIRNSKFYLNQKGFYNDNMDNTYLLFNEFTIPEKSDCEGNRPYGIYFSNSTAYTIEENSFEGINDNNDENIGIYIYNSDRVPNEVYRNNFKDVAYGIVAFGHNRNSTGEGLCLRCNDFQHCLNDIHVIPDLYPNGEWMRGSDQGIAANQGNGSSLSSLAGNTFTDDDLYDETFNYFNHRYCNLIEYYHHSSSPDGVIVKPYPFSDEMMDLTEILGSYEKDVACPSNFGGGGITLEMEKSIVFSENDTVIIYTDSIQSVLDGGDTYSLNFDVMTSFPNDAYQIRQQLLDESPYLSDTVMKSAINKENVLPNAMIRDVLVANPQSAKSSEILDKVDERIDPMPEEMMEEILEGVNIKGDLEMLESNLASHRTLKYKSLHKLESYYKLDTTNIQVSTDSLFSLWSQETDPEILYKKSLLYLSNYDSTSCFDILNSIPQITNLSEIQMAEFDDYSILMEILWSMNQDSSGLDSNKIEQLMDLRLSNTKPGCLARNVLISFGIINYSEPIALADELKSTEAKPYRPRNISHRDSRLELFPNPAKEYIIVTYDLSGLEGDYHIIIYSADGKPMHYQKLNGIKNQVIVTTNNFTPAYYSVKLAGQNGIEDSKNFIIIK